MKKTIEFIKELSKTPRGKGIIFFLFYFVLFLFLILIVKFNSKPLNKEYEPSEKKYFDYSYILDDSYHFKYIITLDGKENIYEGDKLFEEELFTYNDKKYYRKDNKFYLKEDKWKETDNPYIYWKFMDVEVIEKIVKNSYLEYKTEYQSGQIKYNFLVSTNTLNKILNDQNTDIEETPNNMFISSEGDIINNIKYDLASYCLNNKLCKDNLKIEIIYEKFGEIEEIKSPIA